jgi:Flp pilus assembly protein TadD
MPDTSRIDDLRRRVDKDPASIAFAQLAEEYRRAGRLDEAIRVCLDGLDRHPNYVSARVTLGRALLQSDQLDAAQQQFARVLESAPSNLAAVRGLAEILQRRGLLSEALSQYVTAQALAPGDPDIERRVAEVSRDLQNARGRTATRRSEALLATLEQWIAAIHVTRAQRRA